MDRRKKDKNLQRISIGDFVRVSYRYYGARFIAQGMVKELTDADIVIEEIKLNKQLLKISKRDIEKVADRVPAKIFK